MKSGKLWASVGIFVVVALGVQSQQPARGQTGEGESEVKRGFEIAPVTLTIKPGTNRSLVGLGSYLVNGPMDCVGCHTADLYLPGGDPFLGQPEAINQATYLGGGSSFGPFVSRNLTPDASGRPAGLTLDEFKQVMRHGVDLKGVEQAPVPGPTPILQVMPWPAYRHSTERFLEAIYTYLSAIPCVEGGPGTQPNRCLN